MKKLACNTCDWHGGGIDCNKALPFYPIGGKVRKSTTELRNMKGDCKHHTRRQRQPHPMCGCALIPEVSIFTRMKVALLDEQRRHGVDWDYCIYLSSDAHKEFVSEGQKECMVAAIGKNESYSIFSGCRVYRMQDTSGSYITIQRNTLSKGACLPMCPKASLSANITCVYCRITGVKQTVGQPCPHGKGYRIEAVNE